MTTRGTEHPDSDQTSTVRPAGAPAAPAVSQRRLVVGVCATIVAVAFESIAVATAMPVAARDLDGFDYYAWSFSVFVIGMLFATVVGGRLGDRIGPAKPLLVGLAVFAVGLLVAGSATTMGQLIGGRFVQGLGGGVLNVSIFVCVAQVFGPQDRPRMFSYISTAWVLPAFVGPPVSAWLTHQLSWHWVFFAVLPLVVLGGALVLPTMLRLMRSFEPTVPAPGARPPAPLWSAVVVSLAAAALQLAGQRLDLGGLALLVGGLAGLVAGLPRLMPPGFLRFRRGISAVIVVRGLLPGAFFGGEAFIPLMLVEQRGVALVLAGATLTVGAVGWTTGSWIQSRPWLRLRRDRLITVGCLSVALGLASVGTLAFLPVVPFWLAGVGWVFAGFGMGLSVSSTSLAVMTLSEEAEQGRNASSLNLFDALGSSVFVGIAGSLFNALRPGGDLPLTFGVLLLTMMVIAVLAALTSLRIGVVRNEFAPR
ncbi:Major Facilitator Superfamily protein [Friedmanniella luteola]|uniref:Major Facilitator Superfamily protein n=1 Tax=Friedmanniella luteola TaxID=546871 RepID=A0A1H1YED7_9ACTN|nr:MFS transporter [Friedmanniella luteola]SDT19807.1 Major Facilitator Superfamily protein [Friedmanniella luteola]